jgi:DNA-binding MarR family transcriptional regulator
VKNAPSKKPLLRGPARKPAPRGAKRAAKQSPDDAYQPPKTISRIDYLKDGRDHAFRAGVYAMVSGLGALLRCRDIFGKSLNLTGSQFAVLIGTAYRQGTGGVTIRELADHVGLAAPHVTTEVSRLIAMNLLIKRPHTVDRRSVLVCLSPSGEAEVERIAPLVRGVNDILFDGIDYQEFQAVSRVMRTLTVNVEKVFSEMRWGSLSGGSDQARR